METTNDEYDYEEVPHATTVAAATGSSTFGGSTVGATKTTSKSTHTASESSSTSTLENTAEVAKINSTSGAWSLNQENEGSISLWIGVLVVVIAFGRV